MQRWIRLLLIGISIFLGTHAMAQVQVLGVEVGTSTVEQVKAQAGKVTRVTDAGMNKWSAGPMLRSNGNGYGIDGLSEVLYIFDKTGVLAAVVMTLGKDRFDEILGFVSGKYKTVSKQVPFVGDKYVRLKAKGVTIELDAPHLSFQMEARYLRDDFLQRFNASSDAETQEKKSSERGKF